jgi:hypothetical protein
VNCVVRDPVLGNAHCVAEVTLGIGQGADCRRVAPLGSAIIVQERFASIFEQAVDLTAHSCLHV